ncbi:MAG TPA: hypothetical protein VFC65_01590 [Prolixibacteraceae bacterium]|nr:hypothetical protein [Prolixibacteraceae bacterium]
MNTTEAMGNLNEQKGKLKQKFASLMNDHLMFEDGMKDEMSGKQQIDIAKIKEDLHKIISAL